MPEIEIDETDPSTPAAIAQSHGGNDEDVEDGELMDETDEHAIDTNTTTDQPVSLAFLLAPGNHRLTRTQPATTQEPPSAEQPASIGAPVQSTVTTNMPDTVLAGGSLPENQMHR